MSRLARIPKITGLPLRRDQPGLAFVVCAVLFTAWCAARELRAAVLAGVLSFAASAAGWRRLKKLGDLAAGRIAAAGERFSRPGALVAAVVILAGAVALHPLFHGKLIDGHDAAAYPTRLVEMARVVSDGHVAPVWAPDLSAGHGQPLFELSPPLVYWTGLPFHYLGFDLANSLQFGLALLHLLGAFAVYGIGRRVDAPRFAAAGGAIAWLFSPYLCLDLFVRAAFAEAAAVAVAPIALLGVLDTLQRPGARRAALGALAVAPLILAHTAAAWVLMGAFLFLVLAYGAAALQDRKSHRTATVAAGLASLAGAMGITAWFWLPSLAAVPNVHMERLSNASTNWSGHILWPSQLFWAPWGYGYSVVGPNDGMSFGLGLAHLPLALVGLMLIVERGRGSRRALGLTFGLIALGGAWMSTDLSDWAWSHARLLQYMQFPWRLLVIPGLFLPILAMFTLEHAGKRATVVLVLILMAINLPHTEPKRYLTYDEDHYSPESIAVNGINNTIYEEFEPRWVERRPPFYESPLMGLTSPLDVTVISNRTASHEYRIRSADSTTVESAIFYYPGWTLTLDGAPGKITPAPVRGTITFSVPRGEHNVLLELRVTPVRTRAMFISLAALLLLAAAASLEYLRSGRA